MAINNAPLKYTCIYEKDLLKKTETQITTSEGNEGTAFSKVALNCHCQHCRKSFTRRDNYKSHFKEFHQKKTTKVPKTTFYQHCGGKRSNNLPRHLTKFHLNTKHKATKSASGKEMAAENDQVKDELTQILNKPKPKPNKVSSKSSEENKLIVDLSTLADNICVAVRTNTDGSFEILQIVARDITVNPAIIGFAMNNESISNDPYNKINETVSIERKTFTIPHPDKLINLIASINFSSNGEYKVKIKSPLSGK